MQSIPANQAAIFMPKGPMDGLSAEDARKFKEEWHKGSHGRGKVVVLPMPLIDWQHVGYVGKASGPNVKSSYTLYPRFNYSRLAWLLGTAAAVGGLYVGTHWHL